MAVLLEPEAETGLSIPTLAGWTHPGAVGWGGDRWAIWFRGDDEVVVLRTAWDSESDAAEFLAAVESVESSLRWKRNGRIVTGVSGEERLGGRRLRRLRDVLP